MLTLFHSNLDYVKHNWGYFRQWAAVHEQNIWWFLLYSVKQPKPQHGCRLSDYVYLTWATGRRTNEPSRLHKLYLWTFITSGLHHLSQKTRQIRVVISKCYRKPTTQHRCVNFDNLLHIVPPRFSSNLKMSLLNVSSARNTLGHFWLNINGNTIGILVLTETWPRFKSWWKMTSMNPTGSCQFKHKPRLSRVGGLAIICQSYFNIRLRQNMMPDCVSFEALDIMLTIGKISTNIVALNRPFHKEWILFCTVSLWIFYIHWDKEFWTIKVHHPGWFKLKFRQPIYSRIHQDSLLCE